MAGDQLEVFSPDYLYELLEGRALGNAATLPSLAEIVRWMRVLSKLIFMAERFPAYLKEHPELAEGCPAYLKNHAEMEAPLAALKDLLVRTYALYEEEVHQMTNTLFCWDADLRRRPVQLR